MPRLRQELATKAARVEEVDLRWGVTEVMARNAGAVAICLEQLEMCSPLVIGLVGHRVGWLPPVETVERYAPQFAQSLPAGAGITDIELRYAVHLARREGTGPALVMLRSERLSRELDAAGSDWEASAAIRRWCGQDPGLFTVGYDTLEEFETLCEARLRSALATELARPPRARAPTRVLPQIDRKRELRCLAWVTGWRRPTLVFAPRGVGATWLVKRWVDEAFGGLYVDGRATGPGAMIDAAPAHDDDAGSSGLPVSSSAGGREHDALAERRTSLLTATLRNRNGPRRIALDHFDDSFPTEAHADIAWIPARLPWGRALVIVTRSDRLREQARTLGWNVHEITPVTPAAALAFAHEYLAAFAKHLSPAQSGLLGQAPWLGDLGSLVLALDELRRFGRFDALDQRIADLAACKDGADIADEVVAGLRSVLPHPWSDSVDNALLALRLSLRGLEQQELRATCGVLAANRQTGGEVHSLAALPSHLWSAITISLGSGLAARGNYIDVTSGPLLAWCDQRFANDADGPKRVALALDRALADAAPARRWQEAPRITEMIAGQAGLATLMAEPGNVVGMIEAGESFASGWLDRLEPEARARTVAGWAEKLTTADGATAERLAFLAAQCGELDGARRLLRIVGPEIVARQSEARACFIATVTDDRATLRRLARSVAERKPPRERAAEQAMIASLLVSVCADGRVTLAEKEESALIAHALACVRRLDDAILDAQLKLGIGQLALGRARWRRAANEFGAAAGLARGVGNLRLLCRALERLSAVEIERHRFRTARRAAVECAELAAMAGLGEFEALAFERRIEIERRTANWKLAYNLAEAYHNRCMDGIAAPCRALDCLASLEARE